MRSIDEEQKKNTNLFEDQADFKDISEHLARLCYKIYCYLKTIKNKLNLRNSRNVHSYYTQNAESTQKLSTYAIILVLCAKHKYHSIVAAAVAVFFNTRLRDTQIDAQRFNYFYANLKFKIRKKEQY